jgi:hypothetical protein
VIYYEIVDDAISLSDQIYLLYLP